MISKVGGRYIANTLKVTDCLPHIIPCSKEVSDTTKLLYFLPPLRRGALRCSALIAVRSTLRVFMIDTISQESKPSMIASSLAFLNQVLEGRADLRRFCRVQSFGSQGKHRIKSSIGDSLKHQYLSFT